MPITLPKNQFCLWIFLVLAITLTAQVTTPNPPNPPKTPEPDRSPHVVIATNYGDIFIHLYWDTPIHKANFLQLTEEKFFRKMNFHRVIRGFMIQGGDPNSAKKRPWKKELKNVEKRLGEGGPGFDLPEEIRERYLHHRGAIGAAREEDKVNPDRRSSGSQFYIVQGKKYAMDSLGEARERVAKGISDPDFDFPYWQKALYASIGGAPWLDRQYTVFGEVVSGMEVVDSIAGVMVSKKDRPVEKITMDIYTVEEWEKVKTKVHEKIDKLNDRAFRKKQKALEKIMRKNKPKEVKAEEQQGKETIIEEQELNPVENQPEEEKKEEVIEQGIEPVEKIKTEEPEKKQGEGIGGRRQGEKKE